MLRSSGPFEKTTTTFRPGVFAASLRVNSRQLRSAVSSPALTFWASPPAPGDGRRERHGARQVPAEGVNGYCIGGTEMPQEVRDGIADIWKVMIHAVACIEKDENISARGNLTAGQHVYDRLITLGE